MPAGPRLAKSVEVQLLRQWLSQALCEHEYISIPVQGEEGGISLNVFQVLGVNKVVSCVPTLSLEVGPDEELISVLAQHMERWQSMQDEPLQLPETMDAFAYADPCTIDFITMSGLTLEKRSLCHKGQVAESDVEGCIHLHSRRPLSVSLSLTSPNIPALCLLGELKACGFAPREGAIIHEPNSDKVYDARKPTRKRMYYKCLLISQVLFAAGVQSFRSTASQAFFELMLKTKVGGEFHAPS